MVAKASGRLSRLTRLARIPPEVPSRKSYHSSPSFPSFARVALALIYLTLVNSSTYPQLLEFTSRLLSPCPARIFP